MHMQVQRGWIWLAAFFATPVMAQSANPNAVNPEGDMSRVEVQKTAVSDIPAQYRSEAARPRKPFTVRFTCPESGRLYVVFDNAQQTATIELGQTTRYLRQVPSADGGRYANSDESYVFWVKGKRATINGAEVCDAD